MLKISLPLLYLGISSQFPDHFVKGFLLTSIGGAVSALSVLVVGSSIEPM